MGSEEWVRRVDAVIDAVRDDPAAPHMLETLAAGAHSAPHNFHRRFREVVGETPVQFVRRSRLERAAYLMIAAPDTTLTDISAATGFSDSSDFSRSFKRHYGISPSLWSRSLQRNTTPPEGAQTVQIINRPAMRLATISTQGIFGLDDLSTGYNRLCDWMTDQNLELDRSALVGASFDNYRTTPADRIRYTFGFEIPDDFDASGPVNLRVLPAFAAAAVSIDGPLSTIADAWDHIYDQWFPARPWSPAGLPALKLFHRRPDEIGWEHFELDCAVAFRTDTTT